MRGETMLTYVWDTAGEVVTRQIHSHSPFIDGLCGAYIQRGRTRALHTGRATVCMYVCKDSAAAAHARTRAHRPAAPCQSSGVSQTPPSSRQMLIGYGTEMYYVLLDSGRY